MIVPTLIGHSHTVCIVEAMIALGLRAHWDYLDPPEGAPALVEGEGGRAFHPAIAERVRGKVARGDVVLSTVVGNAHTTLGLMETDPPFDFEDPGLDVPLDEGARVVPYGTVRAALAKRLADHDFVYVDAMLGIASGIRMHVQSPPPPRDNALCLARLDPYFRESHPAARIAAPWLRLKLWRLHSDLVREKFAAHRIGFLEAPREAMDEDGFLREAYADGGSATHANNDYGRLVVEQIRRLRA